MNRLTRVELRRLFARRLTRVGVVAVLAITAALLVGTWFDTKPLSGSEQQQMEVQFQAAERDWQQNSAKYLAQCREDWKLAPEPRPPVEEFCNMQAPRKEDFGRPPADFNEIMPALLQGAAYLLAFAGFVIGASFVGAEISTGAIGNWLTFEPRRLRVYASKLLAAAIGMVPLAIGVLAVLVAGTWLIIGHHGDTSGTTGKVWGDLAGTAGRTVALAAVTAALGCVVAVLLRHTAAAIGLAMAYLVLIDGIFGGLLTKIQPWLIRLNFDSWIKHGTVYGVEKCETGPDGSYNCTYVDKVLTFEHSVWYLGILAAVLIVVGGLVFRRRDVT